MEDNLPPGFRFHPTDEELITYYLSRKVSDVSFTSKAVAVVDLNKCEPWDLPGKYTKASMGEKEWYFFSLRDRKYPTGLRTNRATEAGYWKTTGKDKEIHRSGVLVGMKKTLVFYKGRAPRGEKSNWVMHEYRLENKHPLKRSKEEWVVCRVFQKSVAMKKPIQQAPSSLEPSIESPCEENSMVNEFGDIELPNLNTNIANISSSAGFNNMNWAAAREAAVNAAASLPTLSWPSSLLSPSQLSVNSLLLKALQLRNAYQAPRDQLPNNTNHDYSFLAPQGVNISQFGTDLVSSTNSYQASSSNKMIADTMPQQQQQVPFNLDTICMMSRYAKNKREPWPSFHVLMKNLNQGKSLLGINVHLTLIEQNQQQARQILVQNPLLTRALFQAQIMLGMVQPPQVIPNIQPSASQPQQQSIQPTQLTNIQASRSLSGQVGMQDQTGTLQIPTPAREQHQSQPAIPISSAAVPAVNIQSQPMPSHPLQMPQQPKGHLNPQVNPTSLPQSSQLPNLPSHPLHPSSQPPSLHQPQMPTSSSQLQHQLQTGGISHLPLHSPLPPQPRIPSMPNFHNQYPPQMGANMGFQHGGAPQHLSQPMFHSGTKPPNIGPSFPHGQPALQHQQPPQPVYQGGGMHLGTEFNNQVGSSMQVDRNPAWMSGLSENPTLPQLPGQPPLVPAQMGSGNQPSRTPSLTPEMEKALLQQVMSLTPEQINLLPPEQRNQVLQLQQILRQ
ncbi:hypothetical protein FNV43_RR21330 [Rhamnella rubrinervis]|uniref:NAC domain-containing protein n=1 Tax=Rhamnella rubrinervis TaxID=2594499 RepID=A0A8K0GRC2_9ROSA|nr:hypothetical protein FNV43_RR21330 [Rhamnella rubrinervis]